MGRVEWSVWANEQAIASSLLIILGGIVAVSNSLFDFPLAVYSLISGLVILLFEYPRGKRSRGKTNRRKYQHVITFVHIRCGFFAKNYFIRFILYMILATPCCFLLTTLSGGLCLFISSFAYLTAALKGEIWQNPIEEQIENQDNLTEPPETPPPRLLTEPQTSGEN